MAILRLFFRLFPRVFLTCLLLPIHNATALENSVEEAVGSHQSERHQPSSHRDAATTIKESKELQDQPGVILTGIIFNGLNLYDYLEILPLYEADLGKQVDTDRLREIAKAIEEKYHNDGNKAARVVIPNQAITAGIPRFVIFEGILGNIRLAGDTVDNSELLEGYISQIPLGQPLDNNIYQRITLLLNDIPGISATPKMELMKDGSNHIELIFYIKHKPFSGEIVFDNRGSRAIGKNFATAELNSYSLLDKHELLQIETTLTTANNELRYVGLSSIWPTTNGNQWIIEGSHSNAHPGGFLAAQHIEVISKTAYAGINIPLIRGYQQSLFTNIGVHHYESDVDILSEHRFAERLSSLRLNASYITSEQAGHFTQLMAGFHQSLTALNRTDRIDNAGNVSLDKEKFSVLHLQAYRNQLLTDQWSLIAEAKGQYASRGLPASERFLFGGGNMGRAYDPAEIVGDHGISLRGQLQYQLNIDWLPPATNQWLYGFYDIGKIWDKTSDQQLSAASTGLGFRIAGKYLEGSVEIANPQTRAVFQEGSEGNRARVFGSLKLRF